MCSCLIIKQGFRTVCDKTCWDIWHTVVDFEKVAKTLCQLKNPSNHGWVTVPKKICTEIQKGGKRGASQSAVKPPKLRARKTSRKRIESLS